MPKATANAITPAARPTTKRSPPINRALQQLDPESDQSRRIELASVTLPIFDEITDGVDLWPADESNEYWVIDRKARTYRNGTLNILNFGDDEEHLMTVVEHQGVIHYLSWAGGLDECGIKPEFAHIHLRGRVIGLYREAA